MAKRVVWTDSAKGGRKLILQYWLERIGNHTYSRKLAAEFNQRIDYLKVYPEIGKELDVAQVRTTACGHFSIFYLNNPAEIVILAIYDTRRNPEEIIAEIKKLLSR